jgi:hypothetical protein
VLPVTLLAAPPVALLAVLPVTPLAVIPIPESGLVYGLAFNGMGARKTAPWIGGGEGTGEGTGAVRERGRICVAMPLAYLRDLFRCECALAAPSIA